MASKIPINLDTSKEYFKHEKCKQNDDLLLEANIFENGLSKDLTNCSIVVQAKKADNTYIIQNTDITKDKNKFIANLVRDFTRVAGKTEIEVVLTESSKQNTTFSFCLEVIGSVIKGAEESKDLITSLEVMQDAVVEMGKISEETKELIQNSGAASKEEINKVNASLAESTNGMYLSDNTVKAGIEPLTVFSLEYLQQQQLKMLGEFYRNIKKGILQIVCCQGDSLTYGLDQVSSDKRVADTTVFPDGSSNRSDMTRAGITYPEALQSQLNTALGEGKVNILTRGYCGDFVKNAYNRWITPTNANLTIMEYGTNDSRASWVDYKGDVKEFIAWYEKLISREILRGSAVVIVSPPRDRTNDIDIFTFSNALERLALKYNCPFIRGDELMLNYSGDIFSDEVHYNTKGYTIHASRIASAILSRFEKNIITNGSKIGIYPNQDNIYLGSGARYTENEQYPTPSQQDATKGGVIFFHNTTGDGHICIPFYTAEDDLLVYPNVFINDASPVDVILDFEVEQALYSNSDLVEKSKRSKPINKIILNNPTAMFNNRITNPKGYIHIPKKGWHTLLLKTEVNKTTGFYGLEFISFESQKVITTNTNITTFVNGWKNFSDLETSGYGQLVCYKNQNNEIGLRGYVNGGTAKQICNLPTNLRPLKSMITPCYAKYMNPDSEKVAFIEVTHNGGVYFIGDTTNLNRVAINITIK